MLFGFRMAVCICNNHQLRINCVDLFFNKKKNNNNLTDIPGICILNSGICIGMKTHLYLVEYESSATKASNNNTHCQALLAMV